MVGDKKIDFVMTSCLNTYPEGAWLSQDGGTDPGPPGIRGSFRPLVRTTPGGRAPGPRAWGGALCRLIPQCMWVQLMDWGPVHLYQPLCSSSLARGRPPIRQVSSTSGERSSLRSGAYCREFRPEHRLNALGKLRSICQLQYARCVLGTSRSFHPLAPRGDGSVAPFIDVATKARCRAAPGSASPTGCSQVSSLLTHQCLCCAGCHLF